MSNNQKNSLLPLQYELLMSLETLAGSQQILRHFLMKLVNSLNLRHAYFLQKDNEEAGTTEQTFKIPQVMSSNIIEHSVFADYYNNAAPSETRFLECIQIKKDRIKIHINQ